MSGVDSLSVSPSVREIASGGLNVAGLTSQGVKWGGARWVKVTGAGQIEIRLASPNDDSATETITMEDGQTLPVQFVELVSADSDCYPILVGR